jgi:hypothetical protein
VPQGSNRQLDAVDAVDAQQQALREESARAHAERVPWAGPASPSGHACSLVFAVLCRVESAAGNTNIACAQVETISGSRAVGPGSLSVAHASAPGPSAVPEVLAAGMGSDGISPPLHVIIAGRLSFHIAAARSPAASANQ